MIAYYGSLTLKPKMHPTKNSMIAQKELFFIKPKKITGSNLIFRDVKTSDAEFILQLRTNIIKSKFISETNADLQKQIDWIRNYNKDDSQIYFIIEDKFKNRIGTVRIYDKKGDSFCWGSWILKDHIPNFYSIESALIVYSFCLHLGFKNAHFDVRKSNWSVCKFHKRFGANIIGETDNDFLFELSYSEINASLKKYKRYLQTPIEIIF